MKVKVREVDESHEGFHIVAMGLIYALKKIYFCHHESESLNSEVFSDTNNSEIFARVAHEYLQNDIILKKLYNTQSSMTVSAWFI